jgi:hypothetical protein
MEEGFFAADKYMLGFNVIYIFINLWKELREKERIMMNTFSLISNGLIIVGCLVKILKVVYQ